MCNTANEEVSLSVKGGRVTSLLKLLRQHQQPSSCQLGHLFTTPTPVPLTQHEELYTGREERCVQVHRDRKQSDDGGGEAGRDPHQTRTAERKDPPIWSEACCFIFQQNSFSTDIFRDFYCQALTVIYCMVFVSAPHLKVLEDAFK